MAAMQEVLRGGHYILGPAVARFEAAFARYLEVPHCIGVNSGTDALALALRAAGLPQGGEVIVPALTAAGTAAAVVQAGGVPVLADVNPYTRNLDVDASRAAITPRTAAIIAVHLHGIPADILALKALATQNGMLLIEDCAQAHGARVGTRKVGSFGDAAAFSFYPTKNLGAYGDGGACWTRDAALATRMRSLRMYGFEQTYYAEREGLNSRLDPLQAAILQVKLPHLGGWVARRQQIAAAYDALLRPDLTRIATTPGCAHGRHLYVLRVADRDAVRAALQERQVMTGVHYPHPIHRMRGYEFLGYGEGSLPHSERLAQEVLSLPLWPELADAEVERVARAVNAVAPTPGTR